MDRLEFKFAPEGMDAKTGEFAGYGAVFGNRDSHGDVIERGAFTDTLRQWEAKGALPVMKLMHGSAANPFSGSDLPVGKWKAMREDERGLYVEGKLSGMETDRGRYHYALMEDGALSGLSIGFRPVRHAPGTGNIKRRLQAVNLAEVSLVPEGSNDQATITDLKAKEMTDLRDRLAAGDRLTEREMEMLFKSALPLGLSNAEAERAVRINLKGRGAPGGTATDDARSYYSALRC
jgi:uncharacterized protein